MKYTLLIITSLFFLASCSTSCKYEDAIAVTVKAHDSTGIVELYRIEKGDKVLFSEHDFAGKGGEYTFVDSTSSQAFYLVSSNKRRRKIYARKGQEVNVAVKNGQIEFDKLSEENKILDKWYGLTERVRQLSINYRNEYQKELIKLTPFYDAQRKLEEESVAFLDEVNACKDAFFVKAMTAYVDAELNYFKLYHPQMPIIKGYIKEYPGDLYDGIIAPDRLGDKILLDVFEYTVPYVVLYGSWNQRRDHMEPVEGRNPKPCVDYVTCPEIQIEYLLYTARVYKDGRGIKSIENRYMDLFQSGYPLEEFNKLREAFLMKGSSSTLKAIEVKTVEGEVVKMANYIGKILVVDAWATWCGPCMKKRPAFHQLAHEFKGKEVSFIAISLDRSELKWKKVAEKSDLIEILDFNNSFSKAYGISSIPHFLIFDKQGNLVDSPAASPGTGDLKARIEELLAE